MNDDSLDRLQDHLHEGRGGELLVDHGSDGAAHLAGEPLEGAGRGQEVPVGPHPRPVGRGEDVLRGPALLPPPLLVPARGKFFIWR